MMILGRRDLPASMIPRSAACCARKRKSIDWAFSEFRAYIARLNYRKLEEMIGNYHDLGIEDVDKEAASVSIIVGFRRIEVRCY